MVQKWYQDWSQHFPVLWLPALVLSPKQHLQVIDVTTCYIIIIILYHLWHYRVPRSTHIFTYALLINSSLVIIALIKYSYKGEENDILLTLFYGISLGGSAIRLYCPSSK